MSFCSLLVNHLLKFSLNVCLSSKVLSHLAGGLGKGEVLVASGLVAVVPLPISSMSILPKLPLQSGFRLFASNDTLPNFFKTVPTVPRVFYFFR